MKVRTIQSTLRRRSVPVAMVLFALLPCLPNLADTPLRSVNLSPDISILVGEPILVADHSVVAWDLARRFERVDLGAIPESAEVDAYHRFPATGHQLLSFATTTELPGPLLVLPADVVRFDGRAFELYFSAVDAKIPPGVNVDAVTVAGDDLLLSFDTTVDIRGVLAADEDLVLIDKTSAALAFDGSKAGVPAAADLDAAHFLEGNNHLLCSFDIGVTIGNLTSFDEDVLEWSPSRRLWELAVLGSDWAGKDPQVDLDAFSAQAMDDDGDGYAWPQDCDDLNPAIWSVPGEGEDLRLLHDTPANATTTLSWSAPDAPGGTSVVYDVLRSTWAGDFGENLTVCLVSNDPSRQAIDTTTPAPDTTLYFLVRAVNGCGDGELGHQRAGRSCP